MAGQAASSRRSPGASLTYKDGQATVEVDVQGGPDVVHPNPDGRSSFTFTAAGLPIAGCVAGGIGQVWISD